MAQVFCVWFDRFYFEPHLPKTYVFAEGPLPFQVEWHDGGLYVVSVNLQTKTDRVLYSGIIPGLKITKINSIRIGKRKPDYEMLLEDFPLSLDFVEDVDTENNLEAFGLEWGANFDKNTRKSGGIALSSKFGRALTNNKKNNLNNHPQIKNHQFAASSYIKGHEPFEGKLNNPLKCWMPTIQDTIAGDVWFRIDLGMKASISELKIQGNPTDRQMKVTSFWLDYSDTGCIYTTHPMGEIHCLEEDDDIMNGSDHHQKNSPMEASIPIWPPINARYIRIRPVQFSKQIALRIEVYGLAKKQNHDNSFARLVQCKDVTGLGRKALLKKTVDLSPDTFVWQVDNRQLISVSLDRSGVEVSAFVQVTEDSEVRDVHYVCMFTTPNSEVTERVLNEFADKGIGKDIGVMSASSLTFRKPDKDSIEQNLEKKADREWGFAKTVTNRIIVEQLINRVVSSAQLSFDFVLMLIIAAIIAGAGLATNSSVATVASMLVSPLMGPVLALTLGTALNDRRMQLLGLVNELICLVFCIFTGFCFGLVYMAIYSTDEWPTSEMNSRGRARGLVEGVVIAVPSGVGVAVAVMGEYISSVVGVAISASLLPPAVNTGMLFALALYTDAGITDNIRDNDSVSELFTKAAFSFLLTAENIALIWLTALLMFQVKNVYTSTARGPWKSLISYRQKYDQIKIAKVKVRETQEARASINPEVQIAGEQGPIQEPRKSLVMGNQRRSSVLMTPDFRRNGLDQNMDVLSGRKLSLERFDYGTIHTHLHPVRDRRTVEDDYDEYEATESESEVSSEDGSEAALLGSENQG